MAAQALAVTTLLVRAAAVLAAGAAGGWELPVERHPVWAIHMEEAWGPHVLACSILLFFSGILCSAAGIGGGGIYVTLLIVVGGLKPHDAVPLSKAIIFVGAVASLTVNLYTTPAAGAKKSVIDFDTCMIVVPATLIGTFIGVLLNPYVSDLGVVVVLAALLVTMTYMVTKTVFRQRREELAAPSPPSYVQGSARPTPPRRSSGEHLPGLAGVVGGPSKGDSAGGSIEEAQDDEDAIDEDIPLIKPKGQAAPSRVRCSPPRLMDIVLAVWLLLYVAFSGAFRYHIQACHAERKGDLSSWGSCKHPLLVTFFLARLDAFLVNDGTAELLQCFVMLAPFLCCVACAVYYAMRVQKVASWTLQQIVFLQAVAMVSGVLAGLVGIGGGLILSPSFLLMGMEPAVAVGTSATCVLFTAASTTIQYLFTDRVIMSLALVYGSVSVVASFAGTVLVHRVQGLFAHRRSYITAIVAAGVALSSLLAVGELVGTLSRGHT